MGASVFFNSMSAAFATEAFRAARDEAIYEYGHSGYTGTIAEKNRYVMCSEEIFSSYEEAYDFANKLIDKGDERIDDKWGPAGCVKFVSGKDVKYLFFGWASN